MIFSCYKFIYIVTDGGDPLIKYSLYGKSSEFKTLVQEPV